MATGEDPTKNFFPMMSFNMPQRTIKKSSRITKRKPARKNLQQTHFRFGKMFDSQQLNFIPYPSFSLLGGNRKDPLNLNALIQKKKQLTTQSNPTNNDDTNNGNDRPVEILLQPDIFDPLRLDTSSRNDEDLNNLYSIPSNSTNEQYDQKPMTYPTRKNHYVKKRRHLPPPRYGNFQGYYGYRQPNHDQRLRYLEHDWFDNKQVLDVGRLISKERYIFKNQIFR
jgi:hypothetical protein